MTDPHQGIAVQSRSVKDVRSRTGCSRMMSFLVRHRAGERASCLCGTRGLLSLEVDYRKSLEGILQAERMEAMMA